MAVIDNEEMIGVKSVHCIKSTNPSISNVFLLSLLNSKLLNWYFQYENFHMVGKPLAEVKLVFVERLPIKLPDSQQPYITLVDQILAAKKADPAADTIHWEAEIDELVFELYGLTEEEKGLVMGV